MLIISLHYQLDIWVEPQTRKLVYLNEFWEFRSFSPPAVASYRGGKLSNST